jgi:serine/threonine protein kinase
VADSTSRLNPSTDVPDAAPRLIADRYEVVRVLGEGSSGCTLLCSDLREDRRVAVKELHFARLGNWKYLELFEREAKMLSMLHHPGIPRIFDYFEGEGSSATFFIVQEFIEGKSLQQRMESGPMLGQAEIHEVALGLLDVLDYLHGRAPPVIHRDIKPSNVLLRSDGGPTLIDFGGVNVGWQPPGAAGTTVVGTFGYMPPEQLVGQGGPTSDLYSLGATLLHLVTGRSPSDFPFDAGRIEVPENLPIEASLNRLIEALLRPAPRDRPPTAAAARRLLTNPPLEQSTSLVAPRVVAVAPAITPRYSLLGSSGEPRFVNMGEPPRDPEGELRDVYRNLMHPLFPARHAWSDSEHVFWIGFSGVAAVATLGVVPALYGWGLRKRKRKYDDLFRHGVFAPGTIRSATASGGVYATIKYEFEVGGGQYVGYAEYAQEMTRYWSAGDTVAVLYDPEDPSRSCIVYR